MADSLTLQGLLEEASRLTRGWESNSPPEAWPKEVRVLVQLRQQLTLLAKGVEEASALYDPYAVKGADAIAMEERLRPLPTLFTALPPLTATDYSDET